MNWYAIWTHIVAAMESDEEMRAIIGSGEASKLFLAGSRAVEIPSVSALLVTNVEEEVFAPFDFQFDGYFSTLAELTRWETAMMRLFNQPMSVAMGEAEFTASFVSGQLLRGPLTDPYFRRQLDFRFTPVRSRYNRPQPVGD